MAKALGLTPSQQASVIGVPGDADKLDRLAYFVGVYGLAEQAFGDQALAWLRSPNHADIFHGSPPLDHLLKGRAKALRETYWYLLAP